MTEFTEETLKKEIIEPKESGVVMFKTEWCPSCKQAMPAFSEVAAEYEGKIKIGWFDATKSPKVAVEFGIFSVPTTLFFRKGAQESAESGIITKDKLKILIDKLLS